MAIGRRRIWPTAWTMAEIGRNTRKILCSICTLRTSAIRASVGTRNATTGSWPSPFRREHKVSFYLSKDLKQWVHASDFGPAGDTNGVWECPDLLRVPSEGKHGSLWALKVGMNPGAPQGGSGEQYFLGEFDGTSFKVSEEAGAHGWTNYGKDDYCAISFNGIPLGGQPVLLGWMNNWDYASKLPTSPWRGQMSLARKLSLVRDQSGLGSLRIQ